MITDKELLWQQLPVPVVPLPVYALAVSRGRLRAGGAGGVASCALVEAQDAASQWNFEGAGLPLTAVTALLALDDVLLAGGSEGLACSYDGGQNWRQAELEEGLAQITSLAASPAFAQDRRALAGTLESGILRTDDGGRTWISASFGLESLQVNALLWPDQVTLLAGTGAGIYRSRDAGRSWRCIYAGEDDQPLDVETLTTLPGGTLLAALANGELLISRDNGRQWEISLPVPGAQALMLIATATGALLYGTFEHGLFRSDDMGVHWQRVSEQIVHVSVQCQVESAGDASKVPIYAGGETGVSVSYDDGRTWTELRPPPLHDLRQVLAQGEHLLLAGACAGIVEATSAPAWRRLENIDPLVTACRFVGPETLLFSSAAGLEQLSLNDGTRRMLLAGAAGQVAHIALRRDGEIVHLWVPGADGAGLLHSSDGGETWQTLPMPFGVLPLVALEAVARRLVAATYDPRQFQVSLWYSHDDGQTWIRSLEAATRWPIVATCAQPAALSIGNILFLEESAGKWQQVTAPGEFGAIRCVRGFQWPGSSGLLVLTNSGIQRSDDQGQTWRQEHEGLPAEQIVDLVCTGSRLSVLLTGGRVWQRELL